MPRPAHAEMNAAFDDTGRDTSGEDTHVYFDATDTFGRASAEHSHPLLLDDSTSTSAQQQQQPQRSSRRPSYDFEQPSYFPSAAEAAAATTADAQPRHSHRTSSSLNNTGTSSNTGNRSPTLPLHHQRSASRASTPLERARVALGRFGRYVGMRVPGATYASLQTNDDDDPSGSNGPSGSSNRQRPAGVYGGGLNQDGVFGNLSAKPESRNNRRRRRRAADNAGGDGNGAGGENPDDRGSDDDLEDETLPPTYQAAAADSAPPYWESTILGGAAMAGGLYPLAPGGLGWTPGGATVGEIEDLILDGLPIGNFFGFAWNLAVSMCFQFVGFLLTYLLHTTHAAKCGSRAGLGITLIQYGYYLHSRASEGLNNNTSGNNGIPDYASDPDTIGNGGLNAAALFFGEGNTGRTAPSATSTGVSLGTGWWGAHDATARRRWTPEMFAAAGNADDISGTTTSSSNGPLFFFSAGGGETVSSTSTSPNSSSLTSAALNSTEWFAWFLITIGAFLLLTSIFQYWRFYRWGRVLVETARRREREEREANEVATGADAGGASGSDANGDAANGSSSAEGESGPVGFLRRLQTVWASNRDRSLRSGSGTHQRSGEDWVVFPGMSAASRRSRREAASGDGPTTTSSAGENVGDGLWWASIGPGTRLGGSGPESEHRRGGSEEQDEEEEFGILGPNSGGGSHYSPEERRLIHNLRSSGMLG
ncbi:hypothetical protein OC845_004820 [Tilletia horrida]|nr:hypothetical protein OC845_004820 [Tilletia horrida]